jgi:hypothetical protein
MSDDPELPLGSKLEPSPLDAYISAAPDEPTFTLQGGDPLAAPLVVLWARLARARCGLGFEPEATMHWLDKVFRDTQVFKSNEREDLLRRATEAEMVCWAMTAYMKGHKAETRESAEIKPVEARLDLHDYKIYCANRISNAFSEMNDMMSQLDMLDPDNPVIESIRNEIVSLRTLFNEVEPRPGRKLDNVHSW